MKKRRYLISAFFLFLALWTFSNSSEAYAQLVGGSTYPINGVENPPTSFGSITTAVTYLTTNGVTGTGEVVLELSSGYTGETGPLTIGPITGTSSTLGVTFRPASGYTALTDIVGGASPNQHAIRITGSYITLDGRAGGVGTSRDWTVRTTGTNGQMAVRLDNTGGSMTGITVRNLIMIGEAGNTTGAVFQITGNTTNTMSNVVIDNNLITSTAATSATTRGYGITVASAGNVGNTGLIIRNNDVTQFYARGINFTGGFPGALIHNNRFYHTSDITMPTTTEFSGIYISTTTSAGAQFYNNFVYSIRLTNGSTAINGLYIFNGNSAGDQMRYYNNRIAIGALLTGTSTTLSVFGLRENAVSGSLIEIYNNSVFVGGAVPSGTSLTAAFRKQASNFVSLRNNIFFNARTNDGGTGTGTHWGIMTNNITYTVINNNDYFANGVGGVLGTIDGTTTGNRTTIASWKASVPADLSSVSQNPNFVNTGIVPPDLKINSTIATQLESGGAAIAGITTDFEGTPRYPNAGYPENPSYPATNPDIGAHEFGGQPLDLTPPTITYTPLLNTSSTSSRTLNATITDASGVPTTGIGLPVLYWRINAGSWNSAQATHISGSSYQFTFGSGVLTNDVVQYYVVAQDGATPPNVGSNPFAGAAGFTPDPPAASTPPTTPNSYTITDVSLSGDYTVGTTLFNQVTGLNLTFERSVRTVLREVVIESDKPVVQQQKGDVIEEPSSSVSHQVEGTTQLVEVEEVTWIPMVNGKVYEGDLYVKRSENPELNFPDGIEGIYSTLTAAVADLNLRGVGGPVNFLLTDATYPSETFPIVVNVSNENVPTSTNTVTIKPNTGVNSVISGASASSQILRIFRTSYVTIDGSNSGGSTRNLTIQNTSTTSPQVVLIGSQGTTPVVNVTIKNCEIINGANTSSALIVSDGVTAGNPGWFNNISIVNNRISKAFIANYNNAVVATGNGSGLIISNNVFDATGADAVRLCAIYVQGVDGSTVTDNIIQNMTSSAAELINGIWFATGAINGTITGNLISNLTTTSTGSSTPRGIVVSSGVAANINIVSNTIHSNTTAGTGTATGINIFGTTSNVVVQRNLIYGIKNLNTGGWGANGIQLASTTIGANIVAANNVIYDITGHGFASGAGPADNGYGIIVSAGSGYGIFYNTVNLNVNQTVNGLPAAFNVTSGVTIANALDVRDNIFANTQTVGTNQYAIYSGAANTVYLDINYNNYYTMGPNLGFLGAPQPGIVEWRTATGKDLNSLSSDPEFNGVNDLRPIYTSPVIGAGIPITGITNDFLGVTRSATAPSIGAYEEGVIIPIPAGVYTVGLTAFRQATGKEVYFETRTRTVVKDLNGVDSHIDLNADIDEKSGEGQINTNPVLVEVEEKYTVLMENGHPFDMSFFRSENSRGVYPTITAAVQDLNLRGIDGPVTFLLVDTYYPNETYPIDLVAVTGASSTNTITFKPGPNVQTVIPGDVGQTVATIRINTNGQYFILDGSNTTGGTTRDMKISAINSTGTTTPAVHFFSNGSNNVLKNIVLESKNTSTGSGTLILATGDGSNNNTFDNLRFQPIDTSSVRYGIGFYMFSTTTSSGNTIMNSEFFNFADRGITIQGAAGVNSNIAMGNTIYHTVPSAKTTIYGIYVGRNPNGLVEKNEIRDMHSTGASPTIAGVYYLGASGENMTLRIVNNLISLSTAFNQTAGTIRGIDYFGFVANSVEIYYNTVHIGGTGVTGGTTAALTKRDQVTNYTAVDNALINTRSNVSGTGIHYAAQFSNTVATLYTLDNNDYFSNGTGGVLGIYGTTAAPTIESWRTLTTQDQNSFSANPLFVDAGDYRPQVVSPLLNAGIPVTGITTDILGVTRNATTPTVGAYEEGVVAPIAAPSNLIAVADTFFVNLNWSDNSNNETTFYIERKLGDTLSVNPWVLIDSVAANVTVFSDTGLTPNTTYSYRVKAGNPFIQSDYSNLAQATTIIPVELTSFAAIVTGREVNLNWTTATETNNKGFEIERMLDGSWEKIGYLNGKGTTTIPTDYMFKDNFEYKSYSGVISYRLKQIDYNGTFSYSNVVEVDADFSPKEYTLYQNYPNPFNPSTTIKYALPFDSNVKVAVYNLLGEQVAELINTVQQTGYHDVVWNASNISSGIYFYVIQAKSVDGSNDFKSVKKMMLVK